MGLKEGFKRSLTLLAALLVISCAPVEESDAPYDPEGTNLAGGALATSPPTVTSLSPSAAAQGSIVAIAGTNFDSSAVVNFGDLSGTVIARSSALLRVKVPTGATSGSVFVTTSQGTAEAPSFGVLAKITAVSPKRAYPGNTVTLTGSGFTGVTSVRFGEVSVPSFTVVSDTSITCVFPTGGGTNAPTVVKDAGSTTGAAKVTRIFGVSSFFPVRGPEGTVVTISGGGFSAATSVLFGNVAASFSILDDATIEATVPGTAPSASYLTIKTATSKAVSATFFGISRVPRVTRFTPTSGTLPTTVRISGRDLGGVTSISLGGHSITDFQIINGLLIELTIPDNIPSVTAPFTLTSSEGSVTTTASFAATGSAPSLPSDYDTEVLADAPAGYWRFEDSSTANGMTVENSGTLGSAVAGTYFGTVTSSSGAGVTDKAISLMGAGQVVVTNGAAFSAPNQTPFSVEAWITTPAHNSSAFSRIVDQGFNFGAGWTLALSGTSPGSFGLYRNGGVFTQSTARVDDGGWHQLVATFDGTSIKLYVDGQLDSTHFGQGNMGPGHSSLRIGGNQDGIDGESFTGSIDRVAIYPNSVLSLERIQAHYASGAAIP